jgi:hypothetical protein
LSFTRPAAGILAGTMPQLRTNNFYQELTERLRPVMPAQITISHDVRFPSLALAGRSGNSGRLFPTLFIRGPFRFRLRLSAELILRDVQGFVVLELHRPWPGEPTGEAPDGDHLPKPRAALAQDQLRLWYEDESGPVLELAPIPLDRLRR